MRFAVVDRPNTIMLCDRCNLGYDMECLSLPMLEVPMGEWYCPSHVDKVAAHSK